MTDYRKILMLRSKKCSQRERERNKVASRETSKAVFEAADRLGICWPIDDDITNTGLERMLFPDKYKSVCLYVEPDYPYIHRELAKPGVTLTLLWEEYCRFHTLRGNQSAAQIWCWIERFNKLAG